jgi:hypothetical protein
MTRLFELPVVAEMTRWSVDLLCGGISYDLSNGWQVWSKLLSLLIGNGVRRKPVSYKVLP